MAALIIFIVSPITAQASVSRQISFEMLDLNHFELTKSRTYTENETAMIRTQLDENYGNGDGYLSESEVDSFKADYIDYIDQSDWIIMDEGYILKENASVNCTNLAGDANDPQSNITTTFTFDAQPPSVPDKIEHYLRINRELWKYVDLEGRGQYTVNNYLTIVAPEGWYISYSRGLLNETFSHGNSSLTANADLDFEWITVKTTKITQDGSVNGKTDNDPFDINVIWITAIIITFIVIVLLAVTYRTRKIGRKSEEEIHKTGDEALTESELNELNSEKRHIKEEILRIRRELTTNSISKDEAKSKERLLKERNREIEKKLRAENRNNNLNHE